MLDCWERGCKIIFFAFGFDTPDVVQNVVAPFPPPIKIGVDFFTSKSWTPLFLAPLWELLSFWVDILSVFIGLSIDWGTTCSGDVGPLAPPFRTNWAGERACTFGETILCPLNIVSFWSWCTCCCWTIVAVPGEIYR